MEPTVPSARRPADPPSRPTRAVAEPAPTRPDEPPAARKATPAKKAAPAAAKPAPAKKAAPPAARKAAPEPPEDSSPPAPAKRATPAKKATTTVSATARTAPAKKTTPAKKAAAEPAAPARKTAAKKATAKKAAPIKTTPGTKAGPAKKAIETAPAKEAPAATITPVSPAPPVPPSWTRIPATPEAVPEWLAHVAVERFGDQADRYVRWLRDTYPNATPDGLARATVERLARRSWFTALAGPVGVAALLSAEAALVLHIAAAYGQDPCDPARVPELLALVEPKAAGAVLLGRAAGRLLPGAGALVGLLAGRGALDRVAHRAIAYYRPR